MQKMKEFFSNGPGAFVAAITVLSAATEIGRLLRPYAEVLEDIVCAATLLIFLVCVFRPYRLLRR